MIFRPGLADGDLDADPWAAFTLNFTDIPCKRAEPLSLRRDDARNPDVQRSTLRLDRHGLSSSRIRLAGVRVPALESCDGIVRPSSL